jgi:hypothetical protein
MESNRIKRGKSGDPHQLFLAFDERGLFRPGQQRVKLIELAAVLRISEHKLRGWAKRGLIPGAFRPAKRCHWEFDCVDVEQWWKLMKNESHH